MGDIFLLVEERRDRLIVERLLRRAGLPVERVRILETGGKSRAKQVAESLIGVLPVAVLVDLDEPPCADAQDRAAEQLGGLAGAEVFCAIPCIESWLFADDLLLHQLLKEDAAVGAVVRRLPLPEEIPYPKELARKVLGKFYKELDFLDEVDIGRCMARSSSLRTFILGISKMLSVDMVVIEELITRNITNSIFSNLLSEVPSDRIMARTLDGEQLTASRLREHVENGSEVGRRYISDLLRISRDILRRSANR